VVVQVIGAEHALDRIRVRDNHNGRCPGGAANTSHRVSAGPEQLGRGSAPTNPPPRVHLVQASVCLRPAVEFLPWLAKHNPRDVSEHRHGRRGLDVTQPPSVARDHCAREHKEESGSKEHSITATNTETMRGGHQIVTERGRPAHRQHDSTCSTRPPQLLNVQRPERRDGQARRQRRHVNCCHCVDQTTARWETTKPKHQSGEMTARQVTHFAPTTPAVRAVTAEVAPSVICNKIAIS